jgi:hypothetical protein
MEAWPLSAHRRTRPGARKHRTGSVERDSVRATVVSLPDHVNRAKFYPNRLDPGAKSIASVAASCIPSKSCEYVSMVSVIVEWPRRAIRY